MSYGYDRDGIDREDVFSKYKTAEEVAPKIKLSVERLLELAESELIPHVHIDGQAPIFFLPDVKKWIKENSLERCDGTKLPIKFYIQQGGGKPRPTEREIPPSLISIKDRLLKLEYEIPCVYFLLSKKVVVYVGQTTNPGRRISDHQKDKEFDMVLYIPLPQKDLNEIEDNFIQALRPKYNQTIRSDHWFRESQQKHAEETLDKSDTDLEEVK